MEVEDEAKPQAPAKAESKVEEKKVEEKKPEGGGLDAVAKDPKALRELYKNSPTLFKEVLEDAKKEEPKKIEEKPKGQQQSAAPAVKTVKYGETEIKLPNDVDEKMVPVYFEHWKEQGWSPEQVQKEVSFMGDLSEKAKKAAPAPETPQERAKKENAENVAVLKKRWGADYDKNLEVSRRAVLAHGTQAMIERLTTSDPAIVEQFFELGKLDAEDHTPDAGKPRGGKEEAEKPVTQEEQHRSRYKNSPTMKFTR